MNGDTVLQEEKKGDRKTEVLRYLLLSKLPYIFMPIPWFEAARSHRLNQIAPPNQFFGLCYTYVFFLHWMDSYWIVPCIGLSRGCCFAISGVYQINRKFVTAYRNRKIARLTKTEDDIAKLATVRFITHVFFVCHYHLLTHKPAMSSPLVPRLGTRSRLPRPEPWMVQDILEFVSWDS